MKPPHQRRAASRTRATSLVPSFLTSSFRIYCLSALLCVILLIGLPLYFKVSAADGDLDPAFGNGGRVVTSFPGGLDTANGIAVQADGKLVVAGYSGSDFALTRYNTNGSLDASFGVGGMLHTDFPVGKGGLGNALVIQTDGKIVVVGSATDPSDSSSSGFALARYNTDGSLDTSFDGDGRVVTEFAGGSAVAEAVALQPDGKLVLAGTRTDSTTFANVFALARYNTDGSLDNSFDGDGRVTTDISGLNFEQAHAVAIQSNGRIVAAGQGSSAFLLTRYNTDGSLDSGAAGDSTPGDSFGTGGIVTTAFGGTFEEARALAIQSDGRIVAAGLTALSVASEDNFALARYNTDGSPDNSFDGDGKVITDFGLVDAANDVVIQTDGKIVAVGTAGTIAGGSFFALARYNTNGSLDNGFDGDGKVLTDFSGGRFSLGALGVALQTDGRIVAAGDANASGQRDFGVARYNTDGSLDTSFGVSGVGGKVITDFPLNEETITGLVIQTDGKIVAAGRQNSPVRVNGAQDPNFQLARYNTDGTLDTSFGVGGLVYTDFLVHGDDFANALALQTNGRIVVVGQAGAQFSQIPSADTTFAVARYNTDGSLDTSFGAGGLVKTDFGTTHDAAFAVAVQTDGKIVVAGSNGSDFALVRYNTDGSLDSGAAGDSTPGDSFGTGGKVTTDFGGSFDTASAVVIQPNGKIVAAGSNNADFALARYNTDGSLDTTGFGTGGKVTTDFNGGADSISDLIIQPNGKLVAAGSATNPGTGSDFALARYNTDGSLDSGAAGDSTPGDSFGTGGRVTTDFVGFDAANGLALQADGKLLAAGLSSPNASTNGPFAFFALARYNTDGNLDSSFGTGGKLTTDFFGVNNQATSVVIQPNGLIVAGGFADTGSSDDFALARYLSANAPASASVQFNASNFTTLEGTHDIQITLTRTGDTSGVVSVDYSTGDGTAQQRTDYTIRAGTITFGAGETTKTFSLLINDDNYVEGSEQFNVTLSNATGGALIGSPNPATVTITDNDTVSPPNANVIDDAQNFVYQHYHDFLSREPDMGGLDYWTSQITACGTNQQCLRNKRIDVSNAFFFEMEYQDTAAYVYRIYKASFGARPTYAQFAPDRSRVVGSPNLDAMKNAFAAQFVQRTSFNLPTDPAAYVDALNTNTGNSLTQAQRDALVAGLTSGTETRASVLRKVAENQTFVDKEYNNSFILALYFGYLRREPEAGGFEFWLGKINQFPLRSITGQHSLVCSFITSTEYQERFSSVVTHSNNECGQ